MVLCPINYKEAVLCQAKQSVYGRTHGIGSVHHIAKRAALIILMPALNNSVHVDMRAKAIQGVQVLRVVGLLSARSRDKRCGVVRICGGVQVGAINSEEPEALVTD